MPDAHRMQSDGVLPSVSEVAAVEEAHKNDPAQGIVVTTTHVSTYAPHSSSRLTRPNDFRSRLLRSPFSRDNAEQKSHGRTVVQIRARFSALCGLCVWTVGTAPEMQGGGEGEFANEGKAPSPLPPSGLRLNKKQTWLGELQMAAQSGKASAKSRDALEEVSVFGFCFMFCF